jgi:Thioesterase domain
VSMYFDIVRALGPQQPSFGIQATSRMRTVEYAKSISFESLVEQYVGVLIRFQPTGALALVGWWAGGIIALEMAQQLHKLGRMDILLVNIDGELFNTGSDISRSSPMYYLKLMYHFPLWFIYSEMGRSKFINYFRARSLTAAVSFAKIASAWRAIAPQGRSRPYKGAVHTSMIKFPRVTELVKDLKERLGEFQGGFIGGGGTSRF